LSETLISHTAVYGQNLWLCGYIHTAELKLLLILFGLRSADLDKENVGFRRQWSQLTKEAQTVAWFAGVCSCSDVVFLAS